MTSVYTLSLSWSNWCHAATLHILAGELEVELRIRAAPNRYHGDRRWPSDLKLFAKVAVTWKQWLGHASEHLHVADVLLPHVLQRQVVIQELMETRRSGRLSPSVDASYFFHCALAVENALKAVICRKCGANIEEEAGARARIPRMLLGHDLVALAERAGISMGMDEEFALTFLTRYGTWSGKYPLPKFNGENDLTARLSDGNHYMMGGYRTDMVPAFRSFAREMYSWARSMLERETR